MKEKIYMESKVSSKGTDLESLVTEMGIQFPHESLAFFKTIYASIDNEPNKNGVRLDASVEQDIGQLIGTQVNFNHNRAYNVCGTIIDAWVNKNKEIEIAFSFFKTVYPKEYELALELFDKGELTVSFELRVDKENTEVLADGTRSLKRVEFDGVGLLMGVKPAYPEAVVFEQAMTVINDMLNQDSRELVFAKAKDISKFWTEIGEKLEVAYNESKNKEECQVEKKAQDALLAKQKDFVIAEFGEEAVKEWADEDFLNQDKIDAFRKSLNVDAEKSEEVKKDNEASEDEAKESEEVEAKSYDCECLDCGHELSTAEHCKDIKCSECGGEMRRKDRPGDGDKKAEVKEDVEAVKVVTDVVQKVTQEYEENSDKLTVETESVVKVDDVVVEERKNKEEVTYTYAEVEAIKAEYEGKIEAKNKQIDFYKENAKAVADIRAELGSFVDALSDEDLFDEDKLENAKLRKRIAGLEKKNVETASDEDPKVDDVEPDEKPNDKDLDTGAEPKEEVKKEDPVNAVEELVKEKYKKVV